MEFFPAESDLISCIEDTRRRHLFSWNLWFFHERKSHNFSSLSVKYNEYLNQIDTLGFESANYWRTYLSGWNDLVIAIFSIYSATRMTYWSFGYFTSRFSFLIFCRYIWNICYKQYPNNMQRYCQFFIRYARFRRKSYVDFWLPGNVYSLFCESSFTVDWITTIFILQDFDSFSCLWLLFTMFGNHVQLTDTILQRVKTWERHEE